MEITPAEIPLICGFSSLAIAGVGLLGFKVYNFFKRGSSSNIGDDSHALEAYNRRLGPELQNMIDLTNATNTAIARNKREGQSNH